MKTVIVPSIIVLCGTVAILAQTQPATSLNPNTSPATLSASSAPLAASMPAANTSTRPASIMPPELSEGDMTFLLSRLPASEPATQPAGPSSQPTTLPTVARTRLDQLIQTIRQTDNPSTTVAAFAQASGIESGNLELHNAYMRRMLQLGLPQVVVYSAQLLVGRDPGNSLAWGVIGYNQGKRGDWAAAIVGTVRALERIDNDPSLLNNVGQLLAWYDNQVDIPRLPDSVRRIIDKKRETWAKSESYTKAYRKIAAEFESAAKIDRTVQKKVDDARAEAQTALASAQAIDRQYRDLNAQIADHQAQLDNLTREYWLAYWNQTGEAIDSSGRRVIVPVVNQPYLNDLVVRIHDEQRAIAAIKDQADTVLRNGQAAVAAYREKQTAVDALIQQGRGKMNRLERIFRWDPPSVDGVMTPELDRFPVTGGPNLPADPQTQANQKLELARLYMVNNLDAKAIEVLSDLIERYPKTAAADQARQMLAKMPKQ